MIFETVDMEKVRPLFEGWDDTAVFSCLEGVMGKVLVTDLESPRSAAAVIGGYAFLTGEPDPELVGFKREGDFVMVPQSEDWSRLIEERFPDSERAIRYALKKDTRFSRERLLKMAAALPEGYELKRLDGELYDQCVSEPALFDQVGAFGSKEKYLELGRGVAVVKEGRMVSGASSYSRYSGGLEVEVDTLGTERKKGLAGAAAAALILLCLEEGLYPSWDAANRASLGLAEKLGYEFSREYPSYKVGKNEK